MLVVDRWFAVVISRVGWGNYEMALGMVLCRNTSLWVLKYPAAGVALSFAPLFFAAVA